MSSKRSLVLLALLIAGFYALSLGEQEPPQPPISTPPPEIAPETAAQAPAPTASAWPPLSEEPVPPAENKLADNYLVLLDTSGSMGEKSCAKGREIRQTKMQVAVDALIDFAAALPSDANLGVTIFSGTVSTLLPLAPKDVDKLRERLNGISPRAKTPLVGALRAGRHALEWQGRAQGGYGTYRLVVLTDGVSTDGDPGPEAIDIVRQTPIVINAIGFCLGGEHSLNKPGITAYSFASDPRELAASLEKVRAEVPDFSVAEFE